MLDSNEVASGIRTAAFLLVGVGLLAGGFIGLFLGWMFL